MTPVCVVGGGLAGLTAALALARSGFDVIHVAPRAQREDRRTTALLAGSVQYLETLGFWPAVAAKAAPIAVQVLIDDSGRLFRAPYSEFHAAEIDLEAFGYNVENGILLSELEAACARTGRIERMEPRVVSVDFAGAGPRLRLEDGRTIRADLVVAADGRESPVRVSAGISARQWVYPQAAIVLNFSHSLPHRDSCYEFHGSHGPFTIVPLPGDQSSLVWVDQPNAIDAAMSTEPGALEHELERRMHSVLGKVSIVADPQRFPLAGLLASQFGRQGLVLVGEAAHALPPIAAQGFNLGIRDVELLAGLALNRPPSDLGSIGPTYHLRRAADVATRTLTVDLFNRSLLTSVVPVQIGRSAAMWALRSIGPLRRAAMREGVAPGGGAAFPLRHWAQEGKFPRFEKYPSKTTH